MLTMTILICTNLAACTVQTATHSWTRPASARACSIFKALVDGRAGNVGNRLNAFNYAMQSGEKVAVICSAPAESK